MALSIIVEYMCTSILVSHSRPAASFGDGIAHGYMYTCADWCRIHTKVDLTKNVHSIPQLAVEFGTDGDSNDSSQLRSTNYIAPRARAP